MNSSPRRRAGIPMVGDLKWGAHFCCWYQDQADLLDLFVAYYAAGLRAHEQCVWVTSPPLTTEMAAEALLARALGLRPAFETGQICILDHNAWYDPRPQVMYQLVVDAAETALKNGYDGLRAGANIGFLRDRDDWNRFAEFESGLTQAVAGHNALAFCAYDMNFTTASDCVDVLRKHQFCVPILPRRSDAEVNKGRSNGKHL